MKPQTCWTGGGAGARGAGAVAGLRCRERSQGAGAVELEMLQLGAGRGERLSWETPAGLGADLQLLPWQQQPRGCAALRPASRGHGGKQRAGNREPPRIAKC